MVRSRLLLSFLAVSLGSCSYGYNLKAIIIKGRLAFVVDPKLRHVPSCLNAIDVVAADHTTARELPGDDLALVKYGTVWHESLDYDCVDEFPILYGQRFKGKRIPLERAIKVVSAKPLKVGVSYEVTTTTGATGYGYGAFKILPNHTVVNVAIAHAPA